jgi:bifunctional DNase/RNase
MEPGPPDRSAIGAERLTRIISSTREEDVLKKWIILISTVLLAVAVFHETRPSQKEAGIKEMKIMRVSVDPIEGKSVVILEDMDEKRVIPIWIGVGEANAIALEINGVVPPRPMTHDLIKSILEGLDARVLHILIHDVRQNIIYARIILSLNGKQIPVDARPSDAIALALRVKAQIFVTDEIYQTLSIDLGPEEGKGSELSV